MPLQLPKVRSDLEYFDREMEGEDVVVVRDPIRGTYFKYNALQAAMLRSLDGKQTVEEMVARLSEEFDVEVPVEAGERFVTHARKQKLLDIACYGVPEAHAHARVVKALRKRGFKFRDLSSSDAGLIERVASAEAAVFMGGIRHLQAGQPAQALDYFYAVLEINPKNERARTLVDIIQSAYVKATSGSSSDFPTLLVFDPTRILAALDRTIGRFVFSRWAWLFVIALALYAIHVFSDVTLPELEFGALDVVGAVVINILHSLVHELAHGLACYHYGGRVNEIGFTWFYYITLNPYCDTSSSYLFNERSHKIAVQLAGTVITIVVVSLLFIAVSVFQPTVFFYTAIQLILWLEVVILFANLIPFMKFDGYYALCDYLGIPNLRERSFRALKSWAGVRILGLAPNEEKLPAKKRRFFIVFAATSLVFTIVWMYAAIFRYLAPTVEEFKGVGLLIALAVLGYLLRGWLFLPFGRLFRLCWVERRRIFTWRRSLVFAVLLACLVVPWTFETNVRLDATFTLAPKERADVRAQAAGIVDRILVAEGQRVSKGQPLAILRAPELELKFHVAEAELERADAELAQIQLGARSEEILLANSQLGVAFAKQSRTAKRATTAKQLAKGGLGTGAAASSTEAAAAVDSSSANAAYWNLARLGAGSRKEDVAIATAERARMLAQLEHAKAERELLTIRSPIDGVVATRQLELRIGDHLARGDRLAEVADTSEFVAEITLPANAPLEEFSVGDTMVLVPLAGPDASVECTIARIRDAREVLRERQDPKDAKAPEHEEGALVVRSTPFKPALPIVGLSGKARLYGAERTLAYSYLYLPMQRVFRVKLWGQL